MIYMCFFFKAFMLHLLTVFQGKFHGNPMHVAVVISNCLREERRILAAANMPIQVPLSDSQSYTLTITLLACQVTCSESMILISS